MDVYTSIRTYADMTKDNRALDAQYVAFAKANFSKARLDKLLKSRKRLIIARIVPFILLLAIIIGGSIYGFTTEDFRPGETSLVDIVIAIGGVLTIIYVFWFILAQFIIGRLWNKYIKCLSIETSLEEMNRMIDSF